MNKYTIYDFISGDRIKNNFTNKIHTIKEIGMFESAVWDTEPVQTIITEDGRYFNLALNDLSKF